MELNPRTRSEYVYDINMFHRLREEGFDYTLQQTTIDIINRIASKVGAPNYVKTPVFQKKRGRYNGSSNKDTNSVGSGGGGGGGRRNRRKQRNAVRELSNEEWENFRSFEKTTYQNIREGIDATIAALSGLLNKLTDANYEEIYHEICNQINLVKDEIDEEDAKKLSKHIFDIASTNMFYSKIYAKLYHSLCNTYCQMGTVFHNTYDDIKEIFDNFESCTDDDYEKLCIINKVNEKRRALVCFVTNVMNEEMIPEENIIALLEHFITMFKEHMELDNKETICEELCEVISNIIKEGFDKLKSHESFETQWKELVQLSELNTKVYSSLTNKSSFKLMDIVEEYEDEMD